MTRRIRQFVRSRQPRTRGFTILELLLVLTLLVLIAGIVWPALARVYGTHRLDEQTERVRAKLAGTRVRAIDTSVIYQFLYEPGGRWFIVLPFEQESVDPAAAEVNESQQALAARLTYAGRLPDGFEFRPLDPTEPMAGALAPEALALIPGSVELNDVRWSMPILFYPDGTATDYEFDLYDDGNPRKYIRLGVRGLTGTVFVAAPRQEERRFR